HTPSSAGHCHASTPDPGAPGAPMRPARRQPEQTLTEAPCLDQGGHQCLDSRILLDQGLRMHNETSASRVWTIYLSGEIHTDWRDRIKQGAATRKLPVEFAAPVTDHPASDAAGDVL